MSQISVKPDEFGDIIIAFLLEAVRDEDFLKTNPRFREIMRVAEARGLTQALMTEYFSLDSSSRINYKRIQNVFRGGASAKITIGQDTKLTEDTEFDRELCKKIFRKVKEVRFQTSKPITEDRMDKIIDYCLKKQEEQNNG